MVCLQIRNIMALCPECGAKKFSSYTKCGECNSGSIQAREWLGDSEEKTKITSTNDSATTHNQRAKKPTSVSGFGVKLSNFTPKPETLVGFFAL